MSVVDLADLKQKMQDEVQASTPEGDVTKQPVRTALVLIQDVSGHWQAFPNLGIVAQIEPQNVPDGQDMIAGVSMLLSDMQAEKTAQMTMMFMQQAAQAQMQAMQNQAIAQGLHLPKS